MAYSKSGKNFILDLMIAGDRELSDFLQSRPHDEELGESLDLFEKQLKGDGQLTQNRKDDIRSCHIQYLSDLLNSDLPINTVSDIDTNEDVNIQGFCEDQVFLYNADLNESHIRAFADAYQSVDSLYVNYNMAKILLRYHITDKALDYYDKALNIALFSLDSYWNNKESVYAASELMYDLVSCEQFNSNQCDDKILGKVLEYTYLLLSRVILWPDDSDERFDDYEIPITYRHKISSINKRAEILLKHKEYFDPFVPSYSTAEILAIADYALAHDYAFRGRQTGLKSLFKQDANKLYSVLANKDVRPYSTAILDGKNDSIELAHRFYLKLKKGNYQLDNSENVFVEQLFRNIITEKSEPISKIDEQKIKQYLLDNGIEYFYHFTERENIENIKKNGGICSLKYCLLHAIEVSTKGDMTVLRDTDASFGLEDYARLSFCEKHPLIRKRQEAGADLVMLKVKIDIAWRFGTLFSDRDAALPHRHGESIDDLKRVKLDAVRKSNLEEWNPDYTYNQAEVMVKSIVPIDYIVNLDDPIVIQPLDSEYSNDTEITRDNLKKAINTLVFIGDLFRNSSFLMRAEDGRNEKKRLTMFSFAGILGYLFEEEYGFGNYSALVDNEMQRYYSPIRITMSDSIDREKAISDLTNNWSGILQTILEIQTSNSEEKDSFIELQPEIDLVTKVLEKLSGSKCRKPTIGYAKLQDPKRSQFSPDAFTQMVEEAEYNPFSITNEPTLQNFPPLPGDLRDTFRAEILNIYEESGQQRSTEIQIFVSYVYSLIQSYHENAGYVPKNTVDAIIEQCHQAVKGTLFGWYIPTLDEMKYTIYRTLFSDY